MRLFEGRGVAAVEAGQLVLDDGSKETFDEALWCTQAAAPTWLADTGLPLGEIFILSYGSSCVAFKALLELFCRGSAFPWKHLCRTR